MRTRFELVSELEELQDKIEKDIIKPWDAKEAFEALKLNDVPGIKDDERTQKRIGYVKLSFSREDKGTIVLNLTGLIKGIEAMGGSDTVRIPKATGESVDTNVTLAPAEPEPPALGDDGVANLNPESGKPYTDLSRPIQPLSPPPKLKAIAPSISVGRGGGPVVRAPTETSDENVEQIPPEGVVEIDDEEPVANPPDPDDEIANKFFNDGKDLEEADDDDESPPPATRPAPVISLNPAGEQRKAPPPKPVTPVTPAAASTSSKEEKKPEDKTPASEAPTAEPVPERKATPVTPVVPVSPIIPRINPAQDIQPVKEQNMATSKDTPVPAANVTENVSFTKGASLTTVVGATLAVLGVLTLVAILSWYGGYLGGNDQAPTVATTNTPAAPATTPSETKDEPVEVVTVPVTTPVLVPVKAADAPPATPEPEEAATAQSEEPATSAVVTAESGTSETTTATTATATATVTAEEAVVKPEAKAADVTLVVQSDRGWDTAFSGRCVFIPGFKTAGTTNLAEEGLVICGKSLAVKDDAIALGDKSLTEGTVLETLKSVPSKTELAGSYPIAGTDLEIRCPKAGHIVNGIKACTRS